MQNHTRERETKNRIPGIEHFSGKWVAFIGNQPVSWARDLDTLMQKVKKEFLLQKPSVMLIPRKDEDHHALMFS